MDPACPNPKGIGSGQTPEECQLGRGSSDISLGLSLQPHGIDLEKSRDQRQEVVNLRLTGRAMAYRSLIPEAIQIARHAGEGKLALFH